jgi:hypothetical protein
VAVQQGPFLTTRTKEIAGHQPTNRYVLNIFALHNYQHIKRALPTHLRMHRIYDFGDVHELRRTAAAQIRQMKKAKADAEGSDGDEITQALPLFQKNTSKKKSAKTKKMQRDAASKAQRQLPLANTVQPATQGPLAVYPVGVTNAWYAHNVPLMPANSFHPSYILPPVSYTQSPSFPTQAMTYDRPTLQVPRYEYSQPSPHIPSISSMHSLQYVSSVQPRIPEQPSLPN